MKQPTQLFAPGTPTAHAVSPDSGEHWSVEGAWKVADGIYRIPLPLPLDGLKAINVYVLETDEGLTLIDGGWAIEVAREVLQRSLRGIGYGFGDIRRFLVTHVHRDHYTLARVLGRECGADVSLGAAEKPSLDRLNDSALYAAEPFTQVLRAAGALGIAEGWVPGHGSATDSDPAMWRYPDTWLEGDHEIAVGDHTLAAIHTPGHTPGHFVFAEKSARLLFAGDHVLPTITPSIGFTMPLPLNPLGDFMASLGKVRALPDLQVLPAHGPVAPSSHARVDELLAFHERRLELSLAELAAGPTTSFAVARELPWTRHEKYFDELDMHNQGMAAMETMAHLELLVARGQATRKQTADGVVVFGASAATATPHVLT